MGDVEEGAKEVAAVVGGPLGAHVPDAVRAHLAVRLEAGDDVEREVGEAELLQLVVGADPHPALDGHVVADQPDVAQLGGIGGAALDEIELEHARSPLRLAPGDALEHDIGIEEIGAQVHAALAPRVAGDRHIDADVALHHVVDVEPELVAVAVVQDGADAQGRLLVGRGGVHVLPARLGDDAAVDQHVAPGLHGRRGHVDGDIGAVHLVGAQRVAQASLADPCLALDRDVARLQRPAERHRYRELAVDLAVDPCQGHAVLLQQMERLAVQHLQRQGQWALSPEGDPSRARQWLRHVDREGTLESELAAVGYGEGGVRDRHLEGLAVEAHERAGHVERGPAVDDGEREIGYPRASASRARGPRGPPSRCHHPCLK